MVGKDGARGWWREKMQEGMEEGGQKERVLEGEGGEERKDGREEESCGGGHRESEVEGED